MNRAVALLVVPTFALLAVACGGPKPPPAPVPSEAPPSTNVEPPGPPSAAPDAGAAAPSPPH